jgi:hypothetical protein
MLTSVGFHEAIDEAFSTTPESDTLLRKAVVKLILDVLADYCMYPRLEQLIKDIPQLACMLLAEHFGDRQAQDDNRRVTLADIMKGRF